MQVTGIAYRAKNQLPMITTQEANISLAAGLEQDFRRKPGKRQVTVLSQQQWSQACEQVDSELPWTTRRANLLVDGLEFSQDMVGKTLTVGEAQLLICVETEPCHKMDQALKGLRAALTPDWRGGVCCRVIKEGRVKLGDKVSIQ